MLLLHVLLLKMLERQLPNLVQHLLRLLLLRLLLLHMLLQRPLLLQVRLQQLLPRLLLLLRVGNPIPLLQPDELLLQIIPLKSIPGA